MNRISLTPEEKLQAISLKYYQFYTWIPKKGDYYTSVRNDLELYQIIDEDEEYYYTNYCDPIKQQSISKWKKEEFLDNNTFGKYRVFIANWILNIETVE